MTTIRQVMNKPAKALGPEATVVDAVAFLTQHHVGGAPVVDGDGTLLGMVSELALIDVVFDPAVQWKCVTEYMNVDVLAVSPDDSLGRAAQLFALYAFRRLPIVEDGKLVGIFTRRDLMNYALQTSYLLIDPLVELFPTLVPMNGSTDQNYSPPELSFAGLPD